MKNRRMAAMVGIMTALALMMGAAQAVHAQDVFVVSTTISEVDYAEGTVGILTDNGNFGADFATDLISLYLETAARNRYPVNIHFVREKFGEGPYDFYDRLVKVESVEMGTLVITKEDSYMDREAPPVQSIIVSPPDPEYVKTRQTITARLVETELIWVEGEWYDMRTDHPVYKSFAILKSDYDEQAFQKLQRIVDEMIRTKTPVTIEFMGATRAGVDLIKMTFPKYGTVTFK